MTYVMKIIDDTDVDDALEDCKNVIERVSHPLTTKEVDFIKQLVIQYEETTHITERQKTRLERIWNKV